MPPARRRAITFPAKQRDLVLVLVLVLVDVIIFVETYLSSVCLVCTARQALEPDGFFWELSSAHLAAEHFCGIFPRIGRGCTRIHILFACSLQLSDS